MSNVEALAVSVAAMRAAGRLEPADEALVAAAESLAVAVDGVPGDARLWQQYQAALRALREVGPDVGDRDEVERIIAALRGSAQVGDAADKPANARRRGRKAGGGAG